MGVEKAKTASSGSARVESWQRALARPTGVWALLVMLTAVTFNIGESGASGAAVAGMVLVMMMFKAQLVAGCFMELRHAPLLWRVVMGSYLVVVGGGIALGYWLGLQI